MTLQSSVAKTRIRVFHPQAGGLSKKDFLE